MTDRWYRWTVTTDTETVSGELFDSSAGDAVEWLAAQSAFEDLVRGSASVTVTVAPLT